MTYSTIVGLQLRPALLPRVAGARGQGGATRNPPRRGAAARRSKPNCTRISSSTRCTRSRRSCTRNPDGGRSDDQPPERSAAHHVRRARGAPRVSLQEELEFLQKYLEIEQTRFQDRLTVDLRHRSRHARRRGAAAHPPAARRERDQARRREARSGPGSISIASGREARQLWLEVRDNGVGLSAGARARPATSGVGPLEHARPTRVPLRRAHRASSSRTGAEGLAVRMRLPFQPASRAGSDEAASQVA